ncbi:MAG: hypothetical protein AMJ41_01600 [candidate division Zixibacteria bacterium DG_27]|nr:MAG: hypothetical protein AMJ41_01600 [candidate division Zixibacteria bacterium DG_27]
MGQKGGIFPTKCKIFPNIKSPADYVKLRSVTRKQQRVDSKQHTGNREQETGKRKRESERQLVGECEGLQTLNCSRVLTYKIILFLGDNRLYSV